MNYQQTNSHSSTTNLSFNDCLNKYGEYGEVTEINHMLVSVSGLPKVKPEELVVFESGLIGQVFGINENSIDVLLFSKTTPEMGEKAARADTNLCFPVGPELLGNVLNPLGESLGLSKNDKIIPVSCTPIEANLSSVERLKTISRPLQTGIALVDLLLPLGKGQKELVVGDRKTGKSSFLLTIVQNQAENPDNVIIYSSIGKKTGELKSILSFLAKKQIESRVLVIAASANDPTGLIYSAPFSAMTAAEYFCALGKNVILILDDMTNHAKYYREISLLAKRFPGRESYPGDIFHIHARLLERAGNYKNARGGESSISCFPVVETIESDLTGYIPTNLMGITDGHIFFDNNLFQQGKRPAISPFLSVTRVGKQTQSPLKKEIIRELSAFLNKYESLQSYVRFGAELSSEIQKQIALGKSFEKLFQQPLGEPIPEELQIILFGMIWGILINETQVEETKAKLMTNWKVTEEKEKMENLIKVETIEGLVSNVKNWNMSLRGV